MTSSQIKVAVKAMMDFAPAMMRCGEIVQSAEEAEARLAETATRQAAIEGELERRQQRVLAADQEARKLEATVANKRRDAEVELAQLERQVNGARTMLASTEEAIRTAQDLHQATLAKQQKELSVGQGKLDSLKREMRAIHERMAV
jgi:chromosome segregation ATPase